MNFITLFLLITLTTFAPVPPSCTGQTTDVLTAPTYALRDGYCFAGFWIPGTVNVRSYTPGTTHFTTRALWQNPDVMRHSAAYNNIDLTPYIDGIALVPCGLVGAKAYIRHPDETTWTPTIVADCAHPLHAYYHTVYLESGLELGYDLAQHYGLTEHRNEDGGWGIYGFEVCVTDHNPTANCAGEPMDYRAWFLNNVRFN